MKEGSNNPLSEERAQRVAWLVAGYIRDTLTEKEHDELDEWVRESEENQLLFEDLTDPNVIAFNLQSFQSPDSETALSSAKSKAGFAESFSEKGQSKRWWYVGA